MRVIMSAYTSNRLCTSLMTSTTELRTAEQHPAFHLRPSLKRSYIWLSWGSMSSGFSQN
jgi:hypothetical protein